MSAASFGQRVHISTTPSGTAKSREPFIKGMSTAKGQDLAMPMKNLTFELKNSKD
jgi:hypothetical protein